jgi:hypothetical protein
MLHLFVNLEPLNRHYFSDGVGVFQSNTPSSTGVSSLRQVSRNLNTAAYPHYGGHLVVVERHLNC